MAPNSCSLENILFDQFSTKDIVLNDYSDPDKQLYYDSDNFYETEQEQ